MECEGHQSLHSSVTEKKGRLSYTHRKHACFSAHCRGMPTKEYSVTSLFIWSQKKEREENYFFFSPSNDHR